MSTVKATNFQHASAANPAIVLAADGSATANVSAINGGPLAGFRNAIINGNFDHWQRGTSGSSAGYVAADRWVNSLVGSTCTMSRQSFTLGQTDVPGEPAYWLRMAVTTVAGAGNFARLQQVIEDPRTFAGQQVAISFWAKADATKNVSIELEQYFGTGGSPSSVVNAIGTVKKSLTTSWQKITHTVSFPSISGKTLGSDNNGGIVFRIWLDAGSTFNSRTDTLGQQSGTFDIAQVQVEPGPVATPFERRPIGTELALCQRYYETADISNMGAALRLAPPASTAFAAANSHAIYTYKVTKRETPSIGNILWSNASSQVVSPGISSVRFMATATGAAFIDPGFTIDAEL